MSFNMWAVRALQAQAELDEAEFAERAEQIAQRELLKQTAFPQAGSGKCKHVLKGQFCYRCGQKRW